MKLATMVATASSFALPGITRWDRHCCSGGPKTGCEYSQSCKRCELFENAHSASNMKGVVGRPGTTAPTAPKPKKQQPSRKYRDFTNSDYRAHCGAGAGASETGPAGDGIAGAPAAHLHAGQSGGQGFRAEGSRKQCLSNASRLSYARAQPAGDEHRVGDVCVDAAASALHQLFAPMIPASRPLTREIKTSRHFPVRALLDFWPGYLLVAGSAGCAGATTGGA